MKKIIQFIIFAMVISLMFGLSVGATETVAETVAETVTETVTETVAEVETIDGDAAKVEKVKAVLIILAEAETREEAIERVMELEPGASAVDAVDLVDSFIEMTEYLDCRACIMDFFKEGIGYGIEESWALWYIDTYFPDVPDACEWWENEAETVDPGEVDEMIESIVDGVRDGALSPKDAILMVAEIAGMTRDKAEELINKAISAGDAYLQDTTWWEGIRAKVLENLEFFVICIVAGSAILAIVGGAALLYIKVLRPIRNIDYGTSAVAKDSVDIKEAISQALEKLNGDIISALKSGELTRAELLDRDTKHSELEAQLMGALQENADLKRGMVDSEMYILQILKLIYSRTDLTLTDKSVLDMWIAKAESALQSNMDEGDIQKHDEMKEILKGEEGNA